MNTHLTPTGRVGVYVHVPFCARHCPYCDFTVAVVRDVPHEAYADALIAEWQDRRHELDGRTLRTVYFGGGTPGLWEPAQLARVLDAIAPSAELAEVTVEMNPELVTDRQLRALREAGVSRLSFGVQSFDERTLRTLGRAHSSDDARRAVSAASEAGFRHLSVDVMFGVPGDRVGRAAEDAAIAAALPGVDHVSTYELTFEPRTSFERRRRRGELVPPSNDEVADQDEAIEAALVAAGLQQYEASSFARPGGRAVHNSAYWVGDEYLGLGVGAHSLRLEGDHAVRRANVRSLRRYLDSRGRVEPSEREVVSADVHAREVVMTAMRTLDGLDVAALQKRVPACLPYDLLGARWERLGWVTRAGTLWRPTTLGLRHADAMASDLFSE